MRILHSGDLHIGSNRRFPNYLARSEALVNDLITLCSTHKVDVLVLSGDLLDHKNPTLEEKVLIAKLVNSSPVPISIITGTHEYIGPDFENTSLSWLAELNPRLDNLKLWQRPSVEQWNGAWWLAVPHHRWSTADFYIIITWLLHQIPKTTTKPIIGMAHEFFQGALTDTGFGGHGKELPRLPKLARIDYWALADIHKQQRLFKNAWYCGSPMQKDFGEKRPKGVLLVDIGSDPVPIEVTSPAPLIELKRVPKIWPEGYIKLYCNASELPSPLPESVVSLAQISTPVDSEDIKEIHSIVSSKYLLAGMRPFLKGRGLKLKDRNRAISFCKDLVSEIESKE